MAILDKELDGKIQILQQLSDTARDGVITPSRLPANIPQLPNGLLSKEVLNSTPNVVNIQNPTVSDMVGGADKFIDGSIESGKSVVGGLLDFIKENPTTVGASVGGKVLTTYAGKELLSNLPSAYGKRQGLGRMYADYALNYLDGFYAKDANKKLLYAKEFAKTTGRIAKDMLLQPHSLFTYKNTGISPLVSQIIDDLPAELHKVDQMYLDGEFGQTGETAIKRAKQAKRKAMKIAHYKILNDAANRQIFGGETFNALERYRKNDGKPWHVRSSAKEFLKVAGSKAKAEYIMGVHQIGHQNIPGYGKVHQKMFGDDRLGFGKNTAFVKWTDNTVSGVLRGAQFNPKTYFALEELKNKKTIKTLQEARVALANRGIKSTIINNKVVFNFSPNIKSNFDWGGYNTVAEWDIKNRGKVNFIATDLRDTPISSAFGGKNVMNYVEAKDVKIADLKKELPTRGPDKKKRKQRKDVGKARGPRPVKLEDYDARLEILKSGELEIDKKGQYKNISNNINQVRDTRERYLKNIRSKTHYNKAMQAFARSRGGLVAGVGLSAYALLKGATDIFGEDEEIVDPFESF